MSGGLRVGDGGLLIALLLAVLTAALRLDGIADTSITQDESTMVLFAQGVLERGYPFLRQGTEEFIISTYELVPYPIAASLGLLGFSELAVRLPSVLFAAATTILLYAFATALFDRRVGVLAALLLAVLPWGQYWGSNAFYPSQAQFFILVTTVLVYRVIFDPDPPSWLFYGIFAAFSLGYLSWEGSGFVGVVFAVAALLLRWGRWPWITNPHAWCGGALIVLLVIGQLTYRTVLREPFKGVGSGRSDIAFARLVFVETDFDPIFYIRELFAEHHVVLIVFLVIGLVFCVRNERLRFLYLVPAGFIFSLTCFLGYYALRYTYIVLPLLLIASAAAAILLGDALSARLGRNSGEGNAAAARPVGGGGVMAAILAAILAAVQLIAVSPWGLQPSGLLADDHRLARIELAPGHRGFTFRPIVARLAELHQPGDAIIAQAPFPLKVYTGLRGDYLLQTIGTTPVFYVAPVQPFYAEKWLGSPVLRTAADLREVLNGHQRVWFVSTPDGAARSMVGEDVYNQILQDLELVAEGINGRLFLWRNRGFGPIVDAPVAPVAAASR